MSLVRSLVFNNEIYLHEADLSSYIGNPYVMKYPKYEVKVKQCGEQSTINDEDYYISKSEFLTWLEWKLEYEPDDKSKALAEILKYKSLISRTKGFKIDN